jgi:two-component system sensor histidine kinase AlgZ
MHPILARLERLAAYLALWLGIGVFLSAVLTRQGLGFAEAIVLVLPVVIVYSFICLSAWYVCRAMPLATSGVPAVLSASLLAALTAGGLWLATTAAWISLLESLPSLVSVTARYRQQAAFLFTAAVMLFLLVLAVHYVVLAFEAVREAERQRLELEVLTRDAELRALRAQIDPHFLYNSLNSISALTASDPVNARRMCLLLSEFLRSTLHVSEQDTITLEEDLMLAERFLSIEQVRFGKRLQIERHVDEHATACRVPPLLLQPLIENAVVHGIAGLVDGGVIRLDIECRDGRLIMTVENPRDADAVGRRRGGVGLENVRRRLGLVFGGAARLTADKTPDRFRVQIEVPCELP